MEKGLSCPFLLPCSLKPFFDCKGINYKYALLDNFPLFLLLPNLLELRPPALYSPPRYSSPFPYSSGFLPCLPACALPHASQHSYLSGMVMKPAGSLCFKCLSAFLNLRVHNVQEHSYHFDLFHQ